MSIPFLYSQILLGCLEDALEEATAPTPGLIMLRHGEAVRPMLSTQTDECCVGLAWVRVAQVEPFSDPADPGASMNRCSVGHLRRTTLEMGVVRCMPTPEADSVVSEEQWMEVVDRASSDHGAMEAALCCFASTENLGDPELYAGTYVPTGPEGRCIGGTLSLTIEHACACGTAG